MSTGIWNEKFRGFVRGEVLGASVGTEGRTEAAGLGGDAAAGCVSPLGVPGAGGGA